MDPFSQGDPSRDEGRAGADRSDPSPHDLGDELRAVVGTDGARHAPQKEPIGQHVEHAEGPTVLGSVMHEVVRPDVVHPSGAKPDTGAVTESASFPGLGRYLPPLAPPPALDPRVVDPPTGVAQPGRDAALVVADLPASPPDSVRNQALLVGTGVQGNGIRIRFSDVRIRKPPRFGQLPEAGGLVCWPLSVSGGCPFVPLAPWLFRLPFTAACGPLALDAPREAGPDPPDGPGDHGALREKHGLDFLADQAQAVAKVGAHGRQVAAVVEVAIAAVGELAREGDQDEGGVEILAHAALGFGVEGLNHGRSGLVQFLHAPTSMIEITERRDAIATVVEQGGRDAVLRVPVLVPDETDAQGAQRGLVSWRVEGDRPVVCTGGNEDIEHGIGAVPDAEHEVQFALPVGEG